jgi:hypothetical protein
MRTDAYADTKRHQYYNNPEGPKEILDNNEDYHPADMNYHPKATFVLLIPSRLIQESFQSTTLPGVHPTSERVTCSWWTGREQPSYINVTSINGNSSYDVLKLKPGFSAA